MHESEMPTIEDENSKVCRSVDAQLHDEEGKMITAKGNQILGNYQIDSLQTENLPRSHAMVGGVISPPEKAGSLKMKLMEASSAQNVTVPLSSQS